MNKLFSNTGIQFISLPWRITAEAINQNVVDGHTLFDFLINRWTLISLDGSVRDYSRIFWRYEEGGDARQLQPILAIDTAVGEPNEGFLAKADAGKKFRSSVFSEVMPENSYSTHQNWINKEAVRSNITSKGVFDKYKNLIQGLVGETILPSVPDSKKLAEGGVFGAFIFTLVENEAQSLDTNLYIDVGNSRTTAVVYVDTPHGAAGAGFNTFSKLELLNYRDFFSTRRSYSRIHLDSVFPSLIQFRKPPVWSMENLRTFSMLSITSVGEEAQLYKAQLNLKQETRFTGLSSPKRYLWDKESPEFDWYFSNDVNCQIHGEILKHISLEDEDVPEGQTLVDRPLDTDFPRRTMMIHFFVEMFEQCIRYINSPNFRQSVLPDQPRNLKRIVLSYPTAFNQELSGRLMKQAQKALKIIKTRYAIDDTCNIHLGIDEASTVQCVFLQNQINALSQTNFRKALKHQTYHKDKDRLRIASIDIGGGTTDVMVSEFNIDDYNLGGELKGKILFSDGVQYGGDELVKKLIKDTIFPAITMSLRKNNELIDTLDQIITSQDNPSRPMRLSLINLVLYPLTMYALAKASSAENENLFVDLPEVPLLELLQVYVLPAVKMNALGQELNNLEKLLDTHPYGAAHEMGFGQNLINGSPLKLTLSRADFEKQISESELFKTYLKTYVQKIFVKYNPSYILLAGKLSELDFVQESVRNMIGVSPERVKSVSDLKIGNWYPFFRKNKMEDAKTTVSVGVAIADIAKFAGTKNGLSVHIDAKGYSEEKTYYISADYMSTFSDEIQLFSENATVSKPITLSGNRYLIYGSRIGSMVKKQPFGSIHYELSLKKGVIPVEGKPTSLKLQLISDGITIAENSFEGKVSVDDGEPVNLNPSHIRLIPKNVNEDFFLDSGRIW